MMTKSELQSLKDLLREKLMEKDDLVVSLKRQAQKCYLLAVPGRFDGQDMFNLLNATRDALRYEKRQLARLVSRIDFLRCADHGATA